MSVSYTAWYLCKHLNHQQTLEVDREEGRKLFINFRGDLRLLIEPSKAIHQRDAVYSNTYRQEATLFIWSGKWALPLHERRQIRVHHAKARSFSCLICAKTGVKWDHRKATASKESPQRLAKRFQDSHRRNQQTNWEAHIFCSLKNTLTGSTVTGNTKTANTLSGIRLNDVRFTKDLCHPYMTIVDQHTVQLNSWTGNNWSALLSPSLFENIYKTCKYTFRLTKITGNHLFIGVCQITPNFSVQTDKNIYDLIQHGSFFYSSYIKLGKEKGHK